jgi:putative nucleotidyltransferase with HDIG domain
MQVICRRPVRSAAIFWRMGDGAPSDDRVGRLEAEVAELRRAAAVREQQLENYARDLRETFKRERQRARQLHQAYAATVRALANAVEARDAYTGKHAERVSAYGLAIARAAGVPIAHDPEVEFGFLLHDVGKVAVPDAILFKPNQLDTNERAVMERHTVVGWEILRDVDFLGEAKEVVRSHHERWDGGGYPDGLRQDDIPVAARIFAVADTLDALTTDRPYRPGRSFAEARPVILAQAGTQFDPEVVEAYESVSDMAFRELQEV